MAACQTFFSRDSLSIFSKGHSPESVDYEQRNSFKSTMSSDNCPSVSRIYTRSPLTPNYVSPCRQREDSHSNVASTVNEVLIKVFQMREYYAELVKRAAVLRVRQAQLAQACVKAEREQSALIHRRKLAQEREQRWNECAQHRRESLLNNQYRVAELRRASKLHAFLAKKKHRERCLERAMRTRLELVHAQRQLVNDSRPKKTLSVPSYKNNVCQAVTKKVNDAVADTIIHRLENLLVDIRQAESLESDLLQQLVLTQDRLRSLLSEETMFFV